MTHLTEQQINALAKLREPFPASEIRYLPRVWCGNCRDMKGACKNHQRVKCQKCRNNISSAHIDLAYVGHAEATNRLLNIDPAWGWEPVALDEKGLPQHDQNGGLWIRLTVCGVTRLGYGNAEGKRGGDAVKEIIGDAIRNAGMRFGMALDLWTSSDLEIAENGPKDAPVRLQPAPHGQASVPESEPNRTAAAPGTWAGTATPGAAGADPNSVAVKGRSQPAQDFAFSASEAADQAMVKYIYRQASAAGLLGETVKVDRELLQLGAYLIARGKELAESKPKSDAEVAADTARARQEMYQAAEAAGLTARDADQCFKSDYDADSVYGTAEQLRAVAASFAGTSHVPDADIAERELRTVAAKAGLTNLDEEFEKSFGLPIAQAPAPQLREMTAILTGSAA